MATYADRRFTYDVFSNNEVLRDRYGDILFYKDRSGNWVNKQTGESVGTTAPTQYYNTGGLVEGDSGMVNLTPDREFGVNWQEVEKNDPALAAAWGQNSPGFMRDSTGFTHFKVVGYDPETGMYATMTKTGDKEGTLELWGQGEDGSWGVVKNLGTQEWDSNRNFSDQGAWKVLRNVLPGATAMAAGAAAGTGMGATLGESLSVLAPSVFGQGAVLGSGGAVSNFFSPVTDAYNTFSNWANNLGGAADISGTAADFGTNWTNNFGSNDPFSGPGDYNQSFTGSFTDPASTVFEGNFTQVSPGPGDVSNYTPPNVQLDPNWNPNFGQPTTTTPGDPYGPNSNLDGSDPTGQFNNTGTGGTNVSSTTTPKGPNSLVKAVMDGLGISEGAATLLITAVPAIASVFSDHDPQTTTSTSGTPQQIAAKNAIADATVARLPEYMQRDRQRADQQMGWANAAALVPQNYTLPTPVFGANGTGMMGTYKPRGVMGLFG